LAALKRKSTSATIFTVFLAILGFWILGHAATALSGAKASANNSLPARPSTISNVTSGLSNPTPRDDKLKLVIALFRHGVRAPLETFGKNAHAHSKDPWPDLKAWGVHSWGDLTPQGSNAVKALGAYYGAYYSKNAWPNTFKAYLWADSQDQRAIATADALSKGMQTAGINASVDYLKPAGATDPLFHPFTANCGTPSQDKLNGIMAGIRANCVGWQNSFKDQLQQLDQDVLACENGCGQSPCEPLNCLSCFQSPSRSATPTTRPASPIKWSGLFSYASSATEAFLLEYANRMTPAWGRVKIGEPGSPQLGYLLRLHEFYFDKTEREPYLAGILGANLVREVLDELNRKAGRSSPIDGKCPRANADSQFIGLIGHDTNLANVQTLLKVNWTFDDAQLPSDVRGFPANDALPAGALVFELRQADSSDYKVRIQYVTQTLNQIRNAPRETAPFRVQTRCGDANETPCEMSLRDFNKLVTNALGNYKPFLSHCWDGNQVCP
jgi:4-phytase/acid phosphatase